MVRFKKIRGGYATLFVIAEYVIHPCCQDIDFRRKLMTNGGNPMKFDMNVFPASELQFFRQTAKV